MPVFEFIWCYCLSTIISPILGECRDQTFKAVLFGRFPNVKDRKPRYTFSPKLKSREMVLKDCYMVHMHCE